MKKLCYDELDLSVLYVLSVNLGEENGYDRDSLGSWYRSGGGSISLMDA